jgi:hypothetical protein
MKNISDHSITMTNIYENWSKREEESLAKERHKACGFDYFDNNHNVDSLCTITDLSENVNIF